MGMLDGVIKKMMGDINIEEFMEIITDAMARLERMEARNEFIIAVLATMHPKESEEALEWFKVNRREFFYIIEEKPEGITDGTGD